MSLITERLPSRFPVENLACVTSTTPTGREASCFVPKIIARNLEDVKLESDREKMGGLGRTLDIKLESDEENYYGNEGRYGNKDVFPHA